MGADTAGQARAHLFWEQDMERGELHALAGGRAGVFSARCPDKEASNEDAAALLPVDGGRGVLAVADGVGGHPSGGRAARAAVEALATAVRGAGLTGDEPPRALRGAVLDGFEAANRAVCDLGLGSATTLVVAVIQEGAVRTYHAGDSMALLVGQRGKLKHRTVSHSPVGYGVEAGLLDETEALHHADRHLISNALGSDDMNIEMGPRTALCRRDTLLLGSDGLFDNLSLDAIIDHVRKGPLRTVLAALASRCEQRMTAPRGAQPSKPDDLTFVLWRA